MFPYPDSSHLTRPTFGPLLGILILRGGRLRTPYRGEISGSTLLGWERKNSLHKDLRLDLFPCTTDFVWVLLKRSYRRECFNLIIRLFRKVLPLLKFCYSYQRKQCFWSVLWVGSTHEVRYKLKNSTVKKYGLSRLETSIYLVPSLEGRRWNGRDTETRSIKLTSLS